MTEIIPCSDTPYRCDGFDPADWPDGEVPDFTLIREWERREAYRRGYEDGARYLEDTWPVIVAPVIAYRPDHAELDRRRYPPDGRLSWIIPRPGEQDETGS